MPSPKWVSGESGKRGNTYVRRGLHIVPRRDGVCIVAKTPDGDMPQIEYWGRDFAFDTAGDALRQLDMRAI